MKKVLIAGGVAGGASAAARLRRLDEKANIIMFERGEYISYANCGLPYYIGGEIKDRDALTLQTPHGFGKRFNIDVRVLSEVLSVDAKAKTVRVKELETGRVYTESYDKLILSPGAEPLRPRIDGMDNERVFTLRNVPDALRIKSFIDENKPKSAVIVGGGYIGTEMAENLFNAGLDVTIVEFSNHLISSLDFEMAADVHNYLRHKGIKLIFNDAARAIRSSGSQLEIILGKTKLPADMAIISTGVKPESKLAESAGIETSKSGAIAVNERMQTSDRHIYAVGDAVLVTEFISGQKSHIPLAGPANKQGRIAADNICGIDAKYDGTQGSAILKCFDLAAATTGITENIAKRLNLDYEKSYIYSLSHASYYPGAAGMSVKIIFDKKTGALYGAQIVGYEGVDKRIDVFATALRAKMTVYDLTSLELAYAPPFSSAKDPVNMAGYVAENILRNKVRVFHWHDIEKLQKDKNANLIDVRTRSEFKRGSISSFINIPLDELRENIGLLDKSKPVYVTCQSGQRSYIACRILEQNGFDCYNLSGGYRLYGSIYADTQQKGD